MTGRATILETHHAADAVPQDVGLKVESRWRGGVGCGVGEGERIWEGVAWVGDADTGARASER